MQSEKRLVKPGTDGLASRIRLHQGHSYCAVMTSESQRQALLDEFTQCRFAALLPRDGGLIGTLTAAENIELPIFYHSVKDKRLVPLVPEPFFRFGLIHESELQVLLEKLPEQMSNYERRLVGFMRAMHMEPALIVYDAIYDGLARREIGLVAKFDVIFHQYFPFRTSIMLSFEDFGHPQGTHPTIIHVNDSSK